MSLRDVNWKLVFTGILGGTMGATLVVLCFRVGASTQDQSLNLAIMVAAMTVGWLLGILVSPYDQDEQKRFSSVTRAVSAFVSGYLAAKLDALINALVAPDLILNPVAGFRALLFLGAALLATIGTFAYRKYA
ncbi:hypothetical protein EG835_01525 [bacterium]|nr:hypothetical protein [bacterium]